MAFESTVINAVRHLQDAGLKLHFVFNGLESGIGRDPATSSARAAQLGSEAFTLYENDEGKQARDLFKASGMLLRIVSQCGLYSAVHQANVIPRL